MSNSHLVDLYLRMQCVCHKSFRRMVVEAPEAVMLLHEAILLKENRRTGQLPTGSMEIQKQNKQVCFDVKPTEQKNGRKQ